jgi:hypothetical protein
MRSVVIAVVLAACSWTGTEHGSGKPKTEERTVPAFTSVAVDGVVSGVVMAGRPQNVVVTGDDNIVPLIETTVSDQQLRVHTTKSIEPTFPLGVVVDVPALSGVSVSGASSLSVAGVAADSFTARAAGASKLGIAGTAHAATFDLAGASRLDASRLHAEDVTITAAGAGSITVYATGVLDVTVSGMVSVRYQGNPREVKKHAAGNATIEPM